MSESDMNLGVIGKTLVLAGLLLAGFGVLLIAAQKTGFLGRLPGDIVVQRKNFTFYFPLATSLILSLALSLLMWLWSKR